MFSRKSKITLSVIVWIFSFTWLVFWVVSYKNSDAGWFENDTWELSPTLSLLSNPTTDFRGYLKWSVSSTLFWDFTFSWLWASLNIVTNTLCWASDTYSISGKIESDIFWEFDIVDSIYCDGVSEINLTVQSDTLWEKLISTVNTDNLLTVVEPPIEEPVVPIEEPADDTNSNWDNNTSTSWDNTTVPDDTTPSWAIVTETAWDNTISIDWVTSLEWDDEVIATSTSWVNIDLNSQIKTTLKSQINKNLAQLTRNLIPETGDIYSFNNPSSSEKYYYFDFSWDETWDNNWYGNKWKIEELSNGSSAMQVTWYNTVIVKWWNIYIKSNINNTSNTSSLLVLLAQRDNNNNGWNIYIDPSVTNIDAIIIADWSLLSYSSNGIITDETTLWEQLLVYGSVLSNNVVWSNEYPYGSDAYIQWYRNVTDRPATDINIFDLTNLRTTTDWTASVTFKYNPMINISPPYLLKN